MEGDQTISRIQKLQKNIKEKDTSTKEVSKQKDPNEYSRNQEGTPQGTCTKYDLHFNMVCTTWNPHSFLDNLNTNKCKRAKWEEKHYNLQQTKC